MKFKVGDKVKQEKSGLVGKIVYLRNSSFYPFGIRTKTPNNSASSEEWVSKFNCKNRNLIANSDSLKLISKKNMKKAKAEFEVGDKVRNDNEDQRSEILFVVYDEEAEGYNYTLKCLDDDGSVHLVHENDVSEIDTVKKTVEQLVEYYEKNENEEVIVVKK